MYVGKDIVCILALRDFILTLPYLLWMAPFLLCMEFSITVRSSSFFGLGRLSFFIWSSSFFGVRSFSFLGLGRLHSLG